ncbi:hypothetical protein FGB62_74g115 [Gracilaria domingensis]|nr:hypothetical protein FGB62_74g115 [Gracilaria domingensis]
MDESTPSSPMDASGTRARSSTAESVSGRMSTCELVQLKFWLKLTLQPSSLTQVMISNDGAPDGVGNSGSSDGNGSSSGDGSAVGAVGSGDRRGMVKGVENVADGASSRSASAMMEAIFIATLQMVWKHGKGSRRGGGL